jgi:endoglucanase
VHDDPSNASLSRLLRCDFVRRGCRTLAVLAAVGCGAQQAAPSAPAPAPSSHAALAPSPSTAIAAPLTRARVAELLRSVSVAPSAHNLVKNSRFEGGKSLPWMASFSSPATGETSVEGGAYCLDVASAGKNVWDAQVRHREMTILKGHRYSVRFKIAASVSTSAVVKIGMSGPPYRAYWQRPIEAGTEPQVVQADFTMPGADDATAELAFQAGGRDAGGVPFDLCIGDVVLEDPEFVPRPDPPPPPVPGVLVNQVGYLPGVAEIAIVKSDAAVPVKWELVDRSGAVVSSGMTTVRGADAASGDRVHEADFSAFARSGTGYVVRVGGDTSHPFDIGPAVYRKLKYDSLHYFYHTRSGIAITMPYAGAPQWARPAGHPGDKNVPCAPDAHCDYALDVSGGWYDAGDHGKYVVSGGISSWTLMNEYERAKRFGASTPGFGDGTMSIPENHNGVPDLLDEARWELEFMMKMQVPEGKPLAGMAHHKIHDREWTALATRPDQDAIARFLRPVSTSATLNLAATTAQCARIWRAIDPRFAARCLASSERAWLAAAAHPAIYAPAADTVGGGPYEDDDVSDELYWAACELYVTTKKDAYRDFLVKSPHHDVVAIGAHAGDATAMTWQNVAPLGTISLAVVPDGLPGDLVASARAAIVKAALVLVGIDHDEGYRVGFKPDGAGKYPWGSNSSVLNNALVMGLAYDFTKDAKYLDAVANAVSYVLGRNPMDQSYVTGYGFRPLEHPHHRFWAHQANSSFPGPPPGVMSGGPNSGLQDPYVKAAGLLGCAPMKCFVDNIEAWSANEEAINWNAPLAWVAAFLDDHARAPATPAKPAR